MWSEFLEAQLNKLQINKLHVPLIWTQYFLQLNYKLHLLLNLIGYL
jgi:hypothetical protein